MAAQRMLTVRQAEQGLRVVARRWYKKGAHAKGKNVFLRDMEPFIKWLEEAEEDEGEA